MSSASRSKPKLLLTGFSVFPGAPVNPTEALVHQLRRQPDDIGEKCTFRAEVLDVDYSTIANRLAAVADEFAPDIALHFGLAAEATGFRLEKFARNVVATDRPDNAGNYSRGTVAESGPVHFESTLPRTEIVEALKTNSLPAMLDDQAGDYLCNAVFYLSRSGQCGAFSPSMSGFIHIPQLPAADGGIRKDGARLPLADLVRGARIVINVCITHWKRKQVAG
ncbi:MAG: hypothetical protein AB3N20_06610 [Rhizobiaceae bacterium]